MVYDRQTFSVIRNSVDLRDLISGYIDVDAAGKSKCPFHNESNASFRVYEIRFHCYGCGASGDAIDFVSKYDNVSTSEAIKKICLEYSIPINVDDKPLSLQQVADINKRKLMSLISADKREKRKAWIVSRARHWANYIWRKSLPITGDYPYINQKKINPYVARHLGRNIIIPIRDFTGIKTVQIIKENSFKKFIKNGSVSGGWCTLKAKSDIVIIVEGYATACSLRSMLDVNVVIAFNASNMIKVSKVLHDKGLRVIISPDNDWEKENALGERVNAGMNAAQDIIENIDCKVMMTPKVNGITDWNDLACLDFDRARAYADKLLNRIKNNEYK